MVCAQSSARIDSTAAGDTSDSGALLKAVEAAVQGCNVVMKWAVRLEKQGIGCRINGCFIPVVAQPLIYHCAAASWISNCAAARRTIEASPPPSPPPHVGWLPALGRVPR